MSRQGPQTQSNIYHFPKRLEDTIRLRERSARAGAVVVESGKCSYHQSAIDDARPKDKPKA